jgi:hypothetical protein
MMAKKIDPLVKGLKAVRKLLAKPERWTKGYLSRDAAGLPAWPDDEDAVCWCLQGATEKVARANNEGPVYMWSALAVTAQAQDIAEWNDKRWRTHAQVLRLIDRAIARAEKAAS